MELPAKKEKRINDLIKSGKSAIVLVILCFVLGPVGPLLMAVGFLYYFESGSLLKRFPEMPEQLAADLAVARKRFLLLGAIPLGMYVVFIGLIATLILLSDG